MTDYKLHRIFFDENSKTDVQIRRKIYNSVDYTLCFKSPKGEILETSHKLGAFVDSGKYEDFSQNPMPNTLLGWYESAKEFDLLEYFEGTPIITVALKAQAENKPFNQDHQVGLYLPSQEKKADDRIAGIYDDYVSWLILKQIKRNR